MTFTRCGVTFYNQWTASYWHFTFTNTSRKQHKENVFASRLFLLCKNKINNKFQQWSQQNSMVKIKEKRGGAETAGVRIWLWTHTNQKVQQRSFWGNMAKRGIYSFGQRKTSLYQKIWTSWRRKENHWQLDGCKTGERKIKLILCFSFYSQVFHLFITQWIG